MSLKKIDLLNEILPFEVGMDFLKWHKRPLPMQLFLLLCLNLIIAPAVQAATGGELSRGQSYAIGILGLVTLGLSIYLFVVIFQPERF